MQALEMSSLVVAVDLAVLDDISGRYAWRDLPPNKTPREARGRYRFEDAVSREQGRRGSARALRVLKQQQSFDRRRSLVLTQRVPHIFCFASTLVLVQAFPNPYIQTFVRQLCSS